MSDENEREQALENGLITLSGGRDALGNILLAIPTGKLNNLSEWKVENVASLLLYLAGIAKYLHFQKDKEPSISPHMSVACLADLRQASTQTIRQLVDSLESVEHQQRGTVSVVYFLKPKTKSKSHVLKKLLGVKPSKKRPRIPLFKIVLIKTLQELYSHVDVCHLTPDFCGTLRYNHPAWMHLYQVVINCIEGCQNLLTKLPSVRDRVDLLQEYETDGQSSSQLHLLLTDLTEKFHIIITESTLVGCLEESKQTLLLLEQPSSDVQLALVHPDLVQGLRSYLRERFKELDQWNKELEETWRQTESRLTILIQIHKHRERAKEIERKICEHYQPLLREHPIVGKTLSQAELYRAHFTTTLYEPAKELLSQATEILAAVHRLKANQALYTSATALGHEGNVALDVSVINKCLTTSIQPFTGQLQHLQQLYVSVHIFHLLFEKALSWYKKVLKFLPESLLQKCTVDPSPKAHGLSSQHTKESLVFLPTEWLGAVRVFLSRHPPPRDEHIDRLDMNLPQLVDRRLRSQARSLALRLRLLQRVLSSSRLPLQLVTAVMGWRMELFGQPYQEKSSTAHSTHPSNSPTREISRGAVEDTMDPDYFGHKISRNTEVSSAPMNSALSTNSDFQYPNQKESISKDHAFPSHPKMNSGTKSVLPDNQGDRKLTADRLQQRRSSARTILRAKSVEFNFNSSSTDGSVFDYDRAVSGARKAPESMDSGAKMTLTKAIPRKPRRADKDSKFSYAEKHSHWKTQLEEQAFSDPSEILHLRNAASKVDARRPHREKAILKNRGGSVSDTASDEVRKAETWQRANLTSGTSYLDNNKEYEPPAKMSTLKKHKDGQTFAGEGGIQMEINQQVGVDSGTGERFICLTYSPTRRSSEGQQGVFRYGSVDSLLQGAGHDRLAAEAKLGMEAGKSADPYDSIVKSIKEISSCSLSNLEKLKQVSDLLFESVTSYKKALSDKEDDQRIFSRSTLDLRPQEFSPQKEFYGSALPSGSMADESDNVIPGTETHDGSVEAVRKMRRSLEKSIEELNMLLSSSEPRPLTPPAYKRYDSYESTSNQSRYVSELKIQPVFLTPKRTNGGGRGSEIQELDQYRNRSSSDVGATEDVTKGYKSQSHSQSDFEMDTQASMGAQHLPNKQSEQRARVEKGDAQIHSTGEPRFTQHADSGRVHTRGEEGIDLSVVDGEFIPSKKQHPASRPPSLNLLSTRNFISPSFLRPASSMRDLRSTGQSSLTLDLQREIDLDAEYQTLKDMEILQNLQDNPSFDSSTDMFLSPSKQVFASVSQSPPDLDTNAALQSSNTYQNTMLEAGAEHMAQRDESGQALASNTYTESITKQPHVSNSPLKRMSSERDQSLDVSTFCITSPGTSNIDGGQTGEQILELNRLVSQAEQEYRSQEEVANSLQKIQKMLEEEERRRNRIMHRTSDMSFEGEEAGARRSSQDASIDNGYGSWASKLVSQPSTSSEGAGMDPEQSLLHDEWRKSSIDLSNKLEARGVDSDVLSQSITDSHSNRRHAQIGMVSFEKPLTDPDLF